ncbi:hypothetical protein BG004_006655 [Podila humilis]|nr:hypothetical protein BG004_006655 [Podila humilis]
MFCPRLDSALVASIFNDVGDFKQAISILSALAADTVPMSQGFPSSTNSNTNIGFYTTTINNNINDDIISKNNKPRKTTTTFSPPLSTSTKPGSASGSTKSNQENILIWSTEVANSNAGVESKTIGAYPASFNGASTATTASSSAAGSAPKQAFRAQRNPNYKQKPTIPPESVAFDVVDTSSTGCDENDNEEDSEGAQEVESTVVATNQIVERTTKQRGRRKKPEKGTSAGSQLPKTWKKDQNGQHSLNVEQDFSQMTIKDTAEPSKYLAQEAGRSVAPQSKEQGAHADQQSKSFQSGPNTEEIEFLKSCFPDRGHSDEYLAQILRDCNRDLEAAVELILSQMFLVNEQVETSSSGSGSLHSSSSIATTSLSSNTTSSLDDAFFLGTNKSTRQKSKNTTAWGTLIHNPSANIFGASHNDSLMTTIDHQDEFLIPESNEWATFEHQIGILMNIFSTVPRKIIVSEYHSNGTNLFRSVESIEARLKRENYAGSAEGRLRQSEFDVRLAQLMEMFPNHTPAGLKKVLIYNGNNFHDAMNAVLAADFAQAEANARMPKKYANVIPLQADVRFSDTASTGHVTGGNTRLRHLPSTHNPFPNGQRMFPNTILDSSNADLYNDEDDPLWCRQRAHETLDQRNELFRKAARAYKDAKNKGVGMGGIAAFYADEGKRLDVQGKQWHMRAARAVVQQHRLESNDPNLVDLHGLTIAEAQTVVKEAVTQWFSRATMQANRIAAKPLKIICGVGSHSKDRIARLYPTILNLLMKDGWRVEGDQGVIFVRGVSRIMPSNSSNR